MDHRLVRRLALRLQLDGLLRRVLRPLQVAAGVRQGLGQAAQSALVLGIRLGRGLELGERVLVVADVVVAPAAIGRARPVGELDAALGELLVLRRPFLGRALGLGAAARPFLAFRHTHADAGDGARQDVVHSLGGVLRSGGRRDDALEESAAVHADVVVDPRGGHVAFVVDVLIELEGALQVRDPDAARRPVTLVHVELRQWPRSGGAGLLETGAREADRHRGEAEKPSGLHRSVLLRTVPNAPQERPSRAVVSSESVWELPCLRATSWPVASTDRASLIFPAAAWSMPSWR